MTRTDPLDEELRPSSGPSAVSVARRLHGPVPRVDGARNVRLLAVAFGVTVVVTRLFLSLAGYPQIGGGEYHLAHALWGGLLLLIGGVVMLLWSNPWVQPASAVCVGVGSGLFIDEVGKFITARNDYFTPLAAPIIYSAFLAVMGVAVLARRAPLDRPRSLAYTVLVGLKDLADGPLRPRARAELLGHLEDLQATSTRPELAELAARLLPVVESAPVDVPDGRIRALGAALLRVERVLFPRWVHRLALIAASSALGMLSLIGLVVFLALVSTDPDVTVIVDDLTVGRGQRPPVLLVASVGEALVGSMLLVAAGALLVGRDRAGTAIGRVGLLIGLGGVNVALGYVDAELVVVVVVLELMLLVLYERYRSRFVRPDTRERR